MQKRIPVSLDEESIRCLKIWASTGVPAAYAIREALRAYTSWKMKRGELRPQTEGIDEDVSYDYSQ